jgi:hypothetical protein
MDNKELKFKKMDILLIVVLLVVTIAAFLIIQFAVKKDGAVAIIKVDGVKQYELPLDQDTTVEVDGYQHGKNIVVIKNKGVTMTEADCPDKICVNTGTIHKTGETIVCLPHRVVVEIKGTKESLDSVVY